FRRVLFRSWEKCSLGEQCSILMCKRILAAQTNQESGVPFYKIGTIGNTPNAYISKELFDSYKYKYSFPRKGEIMITCAGTVGKCIVFNGEDSYFQDSNIVWIDNPTEKIQNSFLYYVLSNVNWRKLNSTTITRIYNDDLRNLNIAYPSTTEQTIISSLLSLIDERIATQNKIIEKLETLIKGIVDFIFTYYKFTTIPFKDVYSCAGEGGTPATSNPEYYKSGTIPFIKIDDLQNKYIESNKDYITELGLQKSSAWIVPTNSIIYSNGATIGKVSINKYPVCTKQGILGIAPKANMNVEFLYYFMTSTMFAKAIERVVTEGTMRTAYLKDINHILCPIPNSNEQNKIAKLLSALSAKLENEIIFQRKLQKQKEFLLSQMFI
uniref:restriction endonuclease subunit S n=1 Tax=uncultured Alistipes sp. TaxID=538949 RepID=UPI0032203627